MASRDDAVRGIADMLAAAARQIAEADSERGITPYEAYQRYADAALGGGRVPMSYADWLRSRVVYGDDSIEVTNG